MENKIYLVKYSYGRSIGYFKTKKEAKEYCDLMNGKDYNEYWYEDVSLIDLEEFKSKIKHYYKVEIFFKEKFGILTYDIEDIEEFSTTDDVVEYSEYEYEDGGFVLKMVLNSSNVNVVKLYLRGVIDEVNERLFKCGDLESAIKGFIDCEE